LLFAGPHHLWRQSKPTTYPYPSLFRKPIWPSGSLAAVSRVPFLKDNSPKQVPISPYPSLPVFPSVATLNSINNILHIHDPFHLCRCPSYPCPNCIGVYLCGIVFGRTNLSFRRIPTRFGLPKFVWGLLFLVPRHMPGHENLFKYRVG
jgi:hypothetical protein